MDDVRRAYGPSAVVDLLVVALTDHWVRHDAEIGLYLETLTSTCRQTRRYRDAIVVFERIGYATQNMHPFELRLLTEALRLPTQHVLDIHH